MYMMFHKTILPTILRNFDRLSMAHGVESRMPFMDWRLVTYVMSLPDEDKAQNGLSKYIARMAMAGEMPENIRMSGRKIGFNSPMVSWLNGPLADWVENVFAEPNAEYDEIVDTAALRIQISKLTRNKAWTWRSAEHIWPYIQMRRVYGKIVR
jgi:asparagine synthase (glutamine-hydrolysing)